MKKTIALLLACLATPVLADPVTPGPATTPAATADKPQAIAPQMVLAMDRILPGSTEDKIKALLPEEGRAVLNLYLAGQIREWYFRQDRPGAIFLLEADSLEAAQATLDALPLSKAGLIAYDLVPVGPYIPLATLLKPAAPAKKKGH